MNLQPKEEEDLELDMSPMIDMVFLLLIFFIVASQSVEEKPKVDMPSAAYSKIDEDQTGRLMITVKKDGTYYIRSDETARTIEEVTRVIEQEINLDPELRILIRSDSNTKYKDNEKVTIACAQVGAQDIIYATYEE